MSTAPRALFVGVYGMWALGKPGLATFAIVLCVVCTQPGSTEQNAGTARKPCSVDVDTSARHSEVSKYIGWSKDRLLRSLGCPHALFIHGPGYMTLDYESVGLRFYLNPDGRVTGVDTLTITVEVGPWPNEFPLGQSCREVPQSSLQETTSTRPACTFPSTSVWQD